MLHESTYRRYAVAAFITPALAADEFYVVRDSTTKKCMIVDKKPATSTTTVVSEGGKVYTTKTEAGFEPPVRSFVLPKCSLPLITAGEVPIAL